MIQNRGYGESEMLGFNKGKYAFAKKSGKMEVRNHIPVTPPPGPLNAPQVGADKPSEPGRCLLPSFGSQGEHRSCVSAPDLSPRFS